MKWLLTPPPRPSHTLGQWVREIARHHGFYETHQFLALSGLGHENEYSLYHRHYPKTAQIISHFTKIPEIDVIQMTVDCLKTIKDDDFAYRTKAPVHIFLTNKKTEKQITKNIDFDLCHSIAISRKILIDPLFLYNNISSFFDMPSYHFVIHNHRLIIESAENIVDYFYHIVNCGGSFELTKTNVFIGSKSEILISKYFCMTNWINKSESSVYSAPTGKRRGRPPVESSKLEILYGAYSAGMSMRAAAVHAGVSKSLASRYLQFRGRDKHLDISD